MYYMSGEPLCVQSPAWPFRASTDKMFLGSRWWHTSELTPGSRRSTRISLDVSQRVMWYSDANCTGDAHTHGRSCGRQRVGHSSTSCLRGTVLKFAQKQTSYTTLKTQVHFETPCHLRHSGSAEHGQKYDGRSERRRENVQDVRGCEAVFAEQGAPAS